jgi:two-component system LytT family response regulator
MSISVLVVDNEPLARRAIVRLLGEDPELELLGECGDGVSAVTAIRAQSPELVFLDIQMPAITGPDVVATIGAQRMPATVFVTAYEQYAVRTRGTHQRGRNRVDQGGAQHRRDPPRRPHA